MENIIVTRTNCIVKAMKFSFLIFLMFFSTQITYGQTSKPGNSQIKELDFLIGTWEISFDWYDTHKPNSEPEFTEIGTMNCQYDLKYRGEPRFVFCRSELYTDSDRLKGRYREVLEVIQWSRFSNAYERTGVYSNWPATGIEVLSYDSLARAFFIEGELGVQDGMLERYSETYLFNETHRQFERKNVANFSDMPVTEFNLTMTGKGRKKD